VLNESKHAPKCSGPLRVWLGAEHIVCLRHKEWRPLRLPKWRLHLHLHDHRLVRHWRVMPSEENFLEK